MITTFNRVRDRMASSVLTIEEKSFFTADQLLQLKSSPLPKHIAIIMDGNRRWSSRKGCFGINGYFSGHTKGAEVVDEIVDASLELGIEQLTLYAFSTENWRRSPIEVNQLMLLLVEYLKKRRERMGEIGIAFETIGDLEPFPEEVTVEVEQTKQLTKEGEKLTLVLALNYGGRCEITRAAKSLAQAVSEKKLSLEDINEFLFEGFLDTASLPHSSPDLLIRTSGEFRVSNFLLWQLAYSEVYVTKTLWPDFTAGELYLAIRDFQGRKRRLGK